MLSGLAGRLERQGRIARGQAGGEVGKEGWTKREGDGYGTNGKGTNQRKNSELGGREQAWKGGGRRAHESSEGFARVGRGGFSEVAWKERAKKQVEEMLSG